MINIQIIAGKRPISIKACDCMKVNIKDGNTKELEIQSSSVKEVLKELEINLMEVVVKKNDTIIHEDTVLTNEDEITVIKVVFGG